jgi:hypothetical protein
MNICKNGVKNNNHSSDMYQHNKLIDCSLNISELMNLT